MKVIGGIFKGRNLLPPENYNVRPTGAMVKEAIFGKLQFELPGTRFLDLFGGTGAIGIEALSRGAKEVVINDNSRASLKIIRENLSRVTAGAEVINYDYKAALSYLENRKFDFIFADPPYALDCIGEILELSYMNNVIKEGGLMIYEHLKESRLNFSDNHYILIDEKNYSSTTVSFLKRTKE